MEKPLTLQVQEVEQKISDIINEANLSAYVLKSILQGLYQQIEMIEQQQIEEYNKSKESDK